MEKTSDSPVTQREHVKRTVELVDDLHRKVKLEAVRRGVEMRELVAEAVRAYLNPSPVERHRSYRTKGGEIVIPERLVPIIEMILEFFQRSDLSPHEESLKSSMAVLAEQYRKNKKQKRTNDPD